MKKANNLFNRYVPVSQINPPTDGDNYFTNGYYNYSTILDYFKTLNLDLTFTCLEMDDSNAYTAPYYSAPKSLVINVSNLAKTKAIKHLGENALAISNDNQKYQNCAEGAGEMDYRHLSFCAVLQ